MESVALNGALFLFASSFLMISIAGNLFYVNKIKNLDFFDFAPIGLGLALLISNFLYCADVRISSIFLFLSLLSLTGLVGIFSRRKIKDSLQYLGILFSLSTFGSLPALIRGLQFSFFQGNHWDMTSYLASSIAYQKFSISEIRAISTEKLLDVPILDQAISNLTARPAVHILYGVLSYPFQTFTPYFAYLFLCLGGAILSMVVGRVFKLRFQILVPVAFLGFVAFQTLLDMNAWSQIFGSVFWLMAYQCFKILRGEQKNLQVMIYFVFSVACLAVIYSEGNLLLWGLLGFVAAFELIKERKIPTYLPTFAAAIGASLLVTVTNFRGVWSFVFVQMDSFQVQRPNWYRYFFRVFVDDNSAIWSLIQAPSRFLGLYLPVPFASLGSLPLVIQSINVLLAAVGIVWLILILTRLNWRSFYKDPFKLFFTLVVLALVINHRYWILGKTWMMVFPVTFIALLIFLNHWKRSALYAFLGFNCLLATYRVIVASQTASGIHYALPWPSVQNPEQKEKIDYDLLFNLSRFDGCEKVILKSNDAWIKSFASLSGLVNQITVYIPGEIKAYFFQSSIVGTNPEISAPENCVLEKNL